MKSESKYLFIFDFDNTLLNGTAINHLIRLYLNDEVKKSLKDKYKSGINLIDNIKTAFNEMKKINIGFPQIKEAVEKMEMNKGFEQLFESLRSNKDSFVNIIISGGIDLFIKWVTDRYKISDLITLFLANEAEESSEELIKVTQTNVHNCNLCNTFQCKKDILSTYIDGYKKENNKEFDIITYIGDGENDYCPATLLRVQDILFVKEGWSLHELLKKINFLNLKCKIQYWKDGTDINNYLVNNLVITN